MVDWRRGKGSFVNKSEFFWSQHAESLGDVTFLVGPDEEKIKGFKYPLMVTSQKFGLMFSGNWMESRGQAIKVPHVDPTIFRHFLQLLLKDTMTTELLNTLNLLMDTVPTEDLATLNLVKNTVTTEYLDTLNLSMKQIMNLFFLSKEYLVEDLQQTLKDYIRKNTRMDTVLDIYGQIQGKDDEELEQDTLDFITLNTQEVVEQQNFLTASKETVLTILAEAFEVDELSLFQLACRWAESQASSSDSVDEPAVVQTDEEKKKSVRKIVRELLSEIRLPLLTIEEFAYNVRPTGVLDSEEALTLYDYYVTNSNENQKSLDGQTKLILSDILTVRMDPRSGPRASTLFLSDEVSDPVFHCRGEEHFIWLRSSKDIRIHSLGFCGPLDTDSEYDVKIWTTDLPPPVSKKIVAKKGSSFYVPFSTPVLFGCGCWHYLYFSLEGAPTGSTARAHEDVHLEKDGIVFTVKHTSRQIIKIQYSLA